MSCTCGYLDCAPRAVLIVLLPRAGATECPGSVNTTVSSGALDWSGLTAAQAGEEVDRLVTKVQRDGAQVNTSDSYSRLNAYFLH